MKVLASPPAEPLAPASAEPLYVQLANQLAQAISSGEYGPGQQLPPEAALMTAHGISRVTVRQALALLARNGQVVSRRGKGTFVARAPLQQDLSSLQGFQEALRLQGVEPETELMEFSASAGRVDAQVPPDLDLPVRLRRRYCVDGEAFAIVEAYLPRAAAGLGAARAEHLAVYDILEQYLGLHIGKADVAIQCARPKARVLTELGLPPRSHVLLMQRTSYTVAGLPCEHMRIYIVPERYTFRMSVAGPMQLASAIRPVPPGR
ncbi:MAG: GntR family transcriptional regulator [Ottowia sp.]|nr:GntR family transcriptional regulator [Ottowia sp.]